MFRIGLGCGVAAGALKHGIIGRIGVAGGAHAIGVPMVEREKGVITRRQRGWNPSGRRMAGGAGGGPACGHMVGVSGARKVCLMTGVAIGRCAGENIIDVTLYAVDADVRAGQWERSVVVIECCSGPGRCCVAGLTGSGESGPGMVRVRGSVPV